MTSFRTWCAAMESRAGSKVTLSNVAYDVIENERVPPSLMRAIKDQLVKSWSGSQAATTNDPDGASNLLCETLDAASDDSFCKAIEKNGVKIVMERASRIVDRGSLEQYYIKNTFQGQAIKPHVPGRARPAMDLTTDRIKKTAIVRGLRPVAWITKAAFLHEVESDVLAKRTSDNLATHIRDVLGLDALTKGRELFEMRYPDDALDGQRVAAPTFVEGACREVYRSKVDPKDGWGRAVDLSDDKHRDGGPELVHTPINFTSKFELYYLGVVESTRVCSHETLGKACPRQWAPHDVDAVERYTANA